MGARYFSPALGRFISRDPIAFAGGVNLYGYCDGDPINYADPTGLSGESIGDVFAQLRNGDTWREGIATSGYALGNLFTGGRAFSEYSDRPGFGTSRAFWGIGAAASAGAGAVAVAPAVTSAAYSAQGALVTNRLFIYWACGGTTTAGVVGKEALDAVETNCFVAGTPVQTVVKGAHGKYHVVVKPIERVKKGDLVLARNEKTGKTQVRLVPQTVVRHADLVLTVSLADAKSHKIVERITASPEHPFYVSGKGFTPAGRLAIGNAIVTRAGPALAVQSIRQNRRAGGYTVYNFVVEDDHSYFVGTHNGGVWVHNPVGDCEELLAAAIRARDIAAAMLKDEEPAAVCGAFRIDTGEIAVGVSGVRDTYGIPLCAEDAAFRELGGTVNNTVFTAAIRPRNEEIIAVCAKCQTRFPRFMFPIDTLFQK